MYCLIFVKKNIPDIDHLFFFVCVVGGGLVFLRYIVPPKA